MKETRRLDILAIAGGILGIIMVFIVKPGGG